MSIYYYNPVTVGVEHPDSKPTRQRMITIERYRDGSFQIGSHYGGIVFMQDVTREDAAVLHRWLGERLAEAGGGL